MFRSRINPADIRAFRRKVWRHYAQRGRAFPWRGASPYEVLVSEFMLQQTQTVRVVDYYHRFLARFPTVTDLAGASLAEVITIWQGLGYNRRAKFLWLTAQKIVTEFEGDVPKDYDQLRSLPGVGDYTARAVQAFAFSIPSPFVETNIRSAVIEHFFSRPTQRMKAVSDSAILAVIEESLPSPRRCRDWYYALMDLGSALKRTRSGLNQRAKAYTKQSPLKGSLREMRGLILRELSVGSLALRTLKKRVCASNDHERMEKALRALKSDGLIVQRGIIYRLP